MTSAHGRHNFVMKRQEKPKFTFLWFNCEGVLGGTLLAIFAILSALCVLFFVQDKTPVLEFDTLCEMAENQKTKQDLFREKGKTAMVLGYTGETGRVLTQLLAKETLFQKVTLIGRRTVDIANLGSEFEQKVVNFENLDDHSAAFKGHDVVFCCLGTTRGKSGEEGFKRVDYDYVLKAAELSKAGGSKHFQFMSTYGADHNSSALYTGIKGQVEEALKVMHFERLSVFRPAVLLVDREENRPMEAVARFLLKPISKLFPTAITIPIEYMAQAMVNNAITPAKTTVEVFENKAIHIMSGHSGHCQIKDEL